MEFKKKQKKKTWIEALCHTTLDRLRSLRRENNRIFSRDPHGPSYEAFDVANIVTLALLLWISICTQPHKYDSQPTPVVSVL